MLFRAVAAQPLLCDFEFAGAISERQEAEDPGLDVSSVTKATSRSFLVIPEKYSDGISRNMLDGADINSLRVVTKPIAEVNSLNVELGELSSFPIGVRCDECKERIFNVSVAKVGAFDTRDGGNVAGTKGMYRRDVGQQ